MNQTFTPWCLSYECESDLHSKKKATATFFSPSEDQRQHFLPFRTAHEDFLRDESLLGQTKNSAVYFGSHHNSCAPNHVCNALFEEQAASRVGFIQRTASAVRRISKNLFSFLVRRGACLQLMQVFQIFETDMLDEAILPRCWR